MAFSPSILRFNAIVSLGTARVTMRDERIVAERTSFPFLGSINHDLASRAAQDRACTQNQRAREYVYACARASSVYGCYVGKRAGRSD